MRILGSTISLLLTILALPIYGQDSLHIDALHRDFKPTGVRIATDLISISKSITDGPLTDFHFNADIDFYRYFLNLEYGRYSNTWEHTEGIYNNKGSYFRVGPDVNFLHRDPDKSALFFGLRYARASFSDDLSYNYTNGYWGDGTTSVTNKQLVSSWVEMTTGLKVRIYKIIWLGYTARFKFGADPHDNKELVPTYIPGYGRSDEGSTWGFDYWLIIRLPVRK